MKERDYMPIVFFAYNRPEHTLYSLESLSKCHGSSESELFVYCDGPKNSGEEALVREVRELVKSKKWCGKVNIIERDENWGLARSIIAGVTEMLDRYESVMVLEDDLICSRYFLNYMNKALRRYADEEKVMQVSAYMFPIKLRNETDAFFLPFITSWGWGTWRRAWELMDEKMDGYERLKRDASLRYKFDLNDSYPYYALLQKQLRGEVDSWAIRWYLSVFMADGVTLFPVRTMIQNTGFDNSGAHGSKKDRYFSGDLMDFEIERFPSELVISERSLNECRTFLRKGKKDWIGMIKEAFREYFTSNS